MEYALSIHDVSELRSWTPRYGRIYFGSEFCNWKIPSLQEFRKVARFVKSRGLALSITTPYCNDDQVRLLRDSINDIKLEYADIEIIINDWGIYRVCRELGVEMSLGRLLVKQKRDPRIAIQAGVLAPEAAGRLRATGLNAPLRSLLQEANIRRIELDNVRQGIAFSEADRVFKFSLHVPYVFISLTRHCRFGDAAGDGAFRIAPCVRKACGAMKVCNEDFPQPLYIRGNAMFYEHTLEQSSIDLSAVDRIVCAAEEGHGRKERL